MTDESDNEMNDMPWKFLGTTGGAIHRICIDGTQPGESMTKKFCKNRDVTKMALTQDRKQFYAVSPKKGLVKYDFTDDLRYKIENTKNCYGFAITPDEKFAFLSVAGNDTPSSHIIKVNLKNEKTVNEICLDPENCKLCGFEPESDEDEDYFPYAILSMEVINNGKSLVVQQGYGQDIRCSIMIICIRSFKPIKKFQLPSAGNYYFASKSQISPDDRYFYIWCGTSSKVIKIDLIYGKIISGETSVKAICALTLDVKGVFVLSAEDGNLKLQNADTLELIHDFTEDWGGDHLDWATMSRDGSKLWAQTYDSQLIEWSLPEKTKLRTMGLKKNYGFVLEL